MASGKRVTNAQQDLSQRLMKPPRRCLIGEAGGESSDEVAIGRPNAQGFTMESPLIILM